MDRPALFRLTGTTPRDPAIEAWFKGHPGEPGERAESLGLITHNHHAGWKIGQFLLGRRDDHDVVHGLSHDPGDSLEQDLGPEWEPGLGPSHSQAPSAAQDDRVRYHAKSDGGLTLGPRGLDPRHHLGSVTDPMDSGS